jgi:hypothetical protein
MVPEDSFTDMDEHVWANVLQLGRDNAEVQSPCTTYLCFFIIHDMLCLLSTLSSVEQCGSCCGEVRERAFLLDGCPTGPGCANSVLESALPSFPM